MAAKKSATKKKPPSLVFEEGTYFIVNGKSKIDVGRNRRYAERLLAEHK